MRDVRDALMVGRSTSGKTVRRPLSPHLQVYRWPISMALSILHRASGIALAVGCLLLTWWLVAAATSDGAFAGVQWFISSWLGLLMLFGWTLSLAFHFFAGLRHLAWDGGYGYDAPAYNRTAWAVVIATIASTILIWIVGLAVWLG